MEGTCVLGEAGLALDEVSEQRLYSALGGGHGHCEWDVAVAGDVVVVVVVVAGAAWVAGSRGETRRVS